MDRRRRDGGGMTGGIWRRAPLLALTAAVALLLAGVLLGVYNERAYRAQKINEVTVQARILASTVSAAVSFDDRPAAQEYVNALTTNPEAEAAALYDAGGELFVSWVRNPGRPAPQTAAQLPAEPSFADGRLAVAADVTQGGARLGTVYLETITEPLQRRLSRYGAIALLVTMASLVVAVLGVAQAALAKANAQLQARASELAAANRTLEIEMAEREKAQEALRQSQKMEAVGQLTSGIAHDFNNLLTSVLGHLELVLARTHDAAIRRSLETASRAAGRGAKLTQQLLAFSRRQHLQAKPVDLNALVRGMEDMLSRAIGPAVQVEMALPADLWPALVDASQIEVAILNLAINARDAMPLGGRLVLATANVPADSPRRPADLPAGSGGDLVMVSVTDSGTGMDEGTLARAFEPFFTTKEIGKGTGLGLSQVYGLAKQSGGAAEIESALGRGTSVRLYLPRAGAAAAIAAAATGRPAPSLVAGNGSGATPSPAARILLVDDDDDVRDVTAAMLRTDGHAVVEAASGHAALDILDRGEPLDLMVVDYAMPAMSGAEYAREARQRRPELPAIIITGYAEAGLLADVANLGAVLRKPFRQTDLAAAVRAALPQERDDAGSQRQMTGD
jgi:signal transduction histidine kinase/ActR/RegA family two-component response regulator